MPLIKIVDPLLLTVLSGILRSNLLQKDILSFTSSQTLIITKYKCCPSICSLLFCVIMFHFLSGKTHSEQCCRWLVSQKCSEREFNAPETDTKTLRVALHSVFCSTGVYVVVPLMLKLCSLCIKHALLVPYQSLKIMHEMMWSYCEGAGW